MSFAVETGDLFAYPAQALAHGVNCRGLAGAGVAKIMAQRYPNAIRQYKVLATNSKLRLGDALVIPGGLGDRPIIHCASQDWPGPHARPEWLRGSLKAALKLAIEYGITSVALPLIGSGIGGLDPQQAKQIIREVAENSTVAVTLVLLPAAPPNG
jgi:O-acetyl-ADP-ribose deacetylase (regulator of RNase III)